MLDYGRETDFTILVNDQPLGGFTKENNLPDVGNANLQFKIWKSYGLAAGGPIMPCMGGMHFYLASSTTSFVWRARIRRLEFQSASRKANHSRVCPHGIVKADRRGKREVPYGDFIKGASRLYVISVTRLFKISTWPACTRL